MLSFFKKVFISFYTRFNAGLSTLFSRTIIDQQALQDLEKLLLEADCGPATTRSIIDRVKKELGTGQHDGAALKNALQKILNEILVLSSKPESNIYLLVGINGSGKTSAAAKLALLFQKQGKKVLLVAGDTFRAAGASQLNLLAERLGISCVAGQPNQDPASVVYAGAAKYETENFDVMIVDTAGRLQTKTNLMKELEKIKRVLNSQLPDQNISTLLTIDAMLGQNSLEQAKIFHESVALDGAILTKCDGSGKGGIIFALADQLKLPIKFVTSGESLDAIARFDPQDFVRQLLQ